MTNPVVSGSAAPRYEWKQSGGFIFKVKILAMHRIANAVQVGAFFFFLWGGICGWGGCSSLPLGMLHNECGDYSRLADCENV